MQLTTSSNLHLPAVVAAMATLAAACTLAITAPIESPPDTWDPAFNTHPDGVVFQGLLDQYVAEGMPGVVLFVRTPGGTWNGASGYARIETVEPMLATHLHHVASVTKTYMAAAVLALAEDGEIDLDAGISEYLPDTIYSRIPNGGDATVRQLLGHTSGIPDFSGDLAYDLDFLNDPLGAFPTERLLPYIYSQTAWASPGSHYFYSNANYFLLALTVDHAAEGGHAGVISQRILAPLGLDATFYKNETGYPAPAGLVNSYEDVAGDGRLANVTDMATHNADVFAGNAGLIATAADIATFFEALLDGRLLGQEATSEMLEWREPARYGLGINYVDTPYGPGIGHSGGDLGVMSRVRHFPDADATLVLLMNGGDGGVTARLFGRLWEEAMELALEGL
jgi:D-alanyl-D-alanine carboxypeptidase